MPSQPPRPRTVSELKSSILNPALTSHFECSFNPPQPVRDWVNLHRNNAGLGNGYGFEISGSSAEFFNLSCSDASLPGSSLATHEINNDFTGVTERHVYRRQYDDRADFTFYVDHDYNIIFFFENWMSYIVNEQYTNVATGVPNAGIELPNFNYRVNFPGLGDGDGYKTTIYLKKFERDYTGRVLQYRFLNAYPISINSMPVSYDSSQLLKCTVSFNYSRYIVGGGDILVPPKQEQTPTQQAEQQAVQQAPASSPGNPVVPDELVEYGVWPRPLTNYAGQRLFPD